MRERKIKSHLGFADVGRRDARPTLRFVESCYWWKRLEEADVEQKMRPTLDERGKALGRPSAQPHFLARGGGGVDRVEHLLHSE